MTLRFCVLISALLLCLLPKCQGGPVPIVEEEPQIEEDGFLVLVPTVSVNKKGQPTKNEIDYELISIPADIVKRTVREVTSGVVSRNGDTAGSIFITDLNTDEEDEFIITSSQTGGNSYNNDDDTLPILSSSDLSKILSSVATAGLSAASTGANLAGQAKNVLATATKVGTSAVVSGTRAVKWVLQKKATGLRTFAEFAGTGLNYAGRLSSAVLKVILRLPGIKARVISDLIQAGQPFTSAISEAFSESADDISDVFNSQSGVFKDTINILFKLITDVLALKGRVLAGFSEGGLDKGASLITAGVKVGSAFVQTAGDVVSAVGRGVGEFIKVASEADLPPPPQLPKIQFPQLPTITYPNKDSSEDSYSSKSSSNTYL